MIIQIVSWFNFIFSSFRRKQRSSDGRKKKLRVYLPFYLIAGKQQVKFL